MRKDWRTNTGQGWEHVPRKLYTASGECIDLKPGEHVMRVREADGTEVLYVGTPRQLKELKERLEGDGL